MILSKLVELNKDINEYRQEMILVSQKKGISSQEVLKISQKLDEKIAIFQQILKTNQSGFFGYPHPIIR
ncbi:aspartyl-phosphate phosphatase Spo0E family protein [Bacillus salipaludis]|uniref:Spo0E family sporulation regulatory protein-aspartic acid phosphatase n=1 Tax=Bacillus salipaludis TaxID=2547811 RepID=UPI003D1FDC26